MNLFSAVFTGLAVWSSPPSGPATSDAYTIQVATVDVVPNYQVTPLSEADVDVYLRVMRSAADHIGRVSMGSGATGAADPGTYDEAVADRQGVRARYDAIKAAVDAQVGPGAASDTPVEVADRAVLAPHATEIQALQKQVSGFIYGQ
ncbi:MAG: hypothetical protein ABSC92_18310 [Rhizomicrobium sp.]|jgi:hypothetical protein